MIPERNNYWLLDSVTGWQIQGDSDPAISFTPSGDITLDPLPGSANFLDSSLVGSIPCPVALAADCKDRVFVMDAVTNRVTVLNLSTSMVKRIAAFGGQGAGLRHFKAPRSMTVLRSGAIAIADTGNCRVQLFSGPPYVLLHVWGAPDVFMKPCAVASDHCGIVYIADVESCTILRVRASGEWLEPLGTGVLTGPIEVAVAADQTVAVVDGSGANAAIVIFPPDGGKPVRLTLAASPLSLVFDNSGNLYAGTANAIVAKLQPDTSQLNGWSLGGDGVSDVDGSITKLAWTQSEGLIAILKSTTPGVAPRLFSMDPAGAYQLSGTFLIGPLDSDIENCSWHRVRIMGTVPSETSVEIRSATSSDQANWTPFSPCAVLSGNQAGRQNKPVHNPDCLVQSSPGRYLRLQFKLQSKGTVTPQIHAIQVFFPRESYLQYLPSVFSDDDESRLFLDRFLSIFQTTFDDIDSRLDNLWHLFDPYMTPDKVFPWLAAWMALPIDPTLPLPQQRKLLKAAFQNYLVRGTVAGLQQLIQAYTNVDRIMILEHFKLRNWTELKNRTLLPATGGLNEGTRLWSPEFYARLQVGVQSTVGSFRFINEPAPGAEPYDWGANQFSVFFPANPYTVSDTVAKIAATGTIV